MKGAPSGVNDRYRKGKGVARRPVKGITTVELNAISDHQYWDDVRGDDLPAGIEYELFDGGVNSDPGRSLMWWLQ
jgi:lysozyme family protein